MKLEAQIDDLLDRMGATQQQVQAMAGKLDTVAVSLKEVVSRVKALEEDLARAATACKQLSLELDGIKRRRCVHV